MPGRNSPIGVFDSGLGGLTVLRALRELMPSENLIYYGDTAHVPYGSKSAQTVTRYSLDIASFLASKHAKLLVVACNTASSLALPALRRAVKIPVLGVISPGAQAAAGCTRNRRVGIIGTEATIKSGKYRDEIKKNDPRIRVYGLPCPLFVPLVEEGWWDNEIASLTAKNYLSPLRNSGIDTLILGCTHYPVLKPLIQRAMGPKVRLVDSASAMAEQVREKLGETGMQRTGGKGKTVFYASDDPNRFRRMAKNLLGTSPAAVLLKKFD